MGKQYYTDYKWLNNTYPTKNGKGNSDAPYFIRNSIWNVLFESKLFMHNIYEEKEDYQLTLQKFESEFT